MRKLFFAIPALVMSVPELAFAKAGRFMLEAPVEPGDIHKAEMAIFAGICFLLALVLYAITRDRA